MSIADFLDDEPREPPRYDWRAFTDDADWMIRALQTPRKIHSATTPHGRGLDLSHKRDELAMLLAEAHEVYELALEEWETRRTNSYRPKLEDNYDPDEESPPHDWSEYAAYQPTQADWDKIHERHYRRKPGPPGKSRTRQQRDGSDLPTQPLRNVYAVIRAWWRRHVGKPFSPDFNFKKVTRGTDERKSLNWFNPAARLFLMVAQELNTNYAPAHCHWIHEALRKKYAPDS